MKRRNELVRKAESWAKQIGQKEAIKRLVARDVAVTTSEKLCTGRYFSQPRQWLSVILLEEMSKDGLTLDVKAS